MKKKKFRKHRALERLSALDYAYARAKKHLKPKFKHDAGRTTLRLRNQHGLEWVLSWSVSRRAFYLYPREGGITRWKRRRTIRYDDLKGELKELRYIDAVVPPKCTCGARPVGESDVLINTLNAMLAGILSQCTEEEKAYLEKNRNPDKPIH